MATDKYLENNVGGLETIEIYTVSKFKVYNLSIDIVFMIV